MSPLREIIDVISKTGSTYITYHNAVRGGQSHCHIGIMHRKFGKVRTSDARNMLADRQTDRQTDTHRQADHNTIVFKYFIASYNTGCEIDSASRFDGDRLVYRCWCFTVYSYEGDAAFC